jgi:hypothetical protein
MYLIVGIPLILFLSIAFGAFMAHRKEDVGAGKVYGFLFLAGLTFIFILLLTLVRQN